MGSPSLAAHTSKAFTMAASAPKPLTVREKLIKDAKAAANSAAVASHSAAQVVLAAERVCEHFERLAKKIEKLGALAVEAKLDGSRAHERASDAAVTANKAMKLDLDSAWVKHENEAEDSEEEGAVAGLRESIVEKLATSNGAISLEAMTTKQILKMFPPSYDEYLPKSVVRVKMHEDKGDEEEDDEDDDEEEEDV